MSSQFPAPPPLHPSAIEARRQTDDGRATASMVWGIVGLIICGVILGPIAIWLAVKSGTDGAGRRRGKATAGLVLGILDIVLFAAGFAIYANR